MRLNQASLLFSLMAGCAPALADDTLRQAGTLLESQKAAEAVALLAPLEDTRAGEPAYDYLLGQALLDSGDPSQAVFAFERCLAVEPNNGPCRVMIARAHLAIGETANARVELETIREHNPPPEIQTLITRFLGTVDTQEKRKKRQLDGYVQLGLGQDSNINSATDLKQVAIPALNNLLLGVNPLSRQRDSLLVQGQLAGNYRHNLSNGFTALANAELLVRSYPDESDYSFTTLDASGGAALDRGPHQYIGKLQLQDMQLDGSAYRRMTGLLGQYQYAVSEDSRLSAWLQHGQLRYEQSTRDADRSTLGIAWSQRLGLRYAPAVFASLYSGSEDTRQAAYNAWGMDFQGLRSGASLLLRRDLKLNATLSLEKRDYQGVFPAFGMARRDNETSLNIGMVWQFAPAISLQPSLGLTRNSSNIPLTDFDRQVFSVDIRFDL